MQTLVLTFILLFLCVQGKDVSISVVTVVPAFGTNVGQLSYRTPISIFFSKPVIALGSDFGSALPSNLNPFKFNWPSAPVPGKVRWVTTSIARFDPDIDWPPYVSFTLDVNITASVDGTPITYVNPVSKFNTGAASVYITSVTSSKTNTTSGGTWSPYTSIQSPSGNESWTGPEVPPDGVISLSFSTDVEIANLANAFDITPADSKPAIKINYTVASCGSQCVTVIPSTSDLVQDTRYTLTLNAGTTLNKYTGPVTAPISNTFYGLYGFRFAFSSNFVGSQYRYRLFVRHGLNSAVTPSALANAFSLKDKSNALIPIIVSSPAVHYIEIYAPALSPSNSYVLNIAASLQVTDGWDLPLTAQSFSFSTAPQSSFVLNAVPGSSSLAQFEEFSSLPSWQIVGRNVSKNCGGYHGSVTFTIVTDKNLLQVIQSLHSSSSGVSSPDLVVAAEGNNTRATPWGSSGAFLMETYFSCWNQNVYKQSYVISQNTIGVTALPSSGSVALWVTDLTTGTVLPSVSVQLFGYQYNTNSALFLVKGTTDQNGLAKLQTNFQGTVVAVVTSGQKIQIVSGVAISQTPRGIPSKVNADVITDRGFYKPGDTIYIKGYIRPTGTTINTPLSLSVAWTSSSVSNTASSSTSSSSAPTQISINTYDSSYGSFDLSVLVPLDAEPGSRSIRLQDSKQLTLAEQSFVIATPRIPTVEMDFSTGTAICILGTPLSLSINLATYTGVNIPNAEVKLKWEITKVESFPWLAKGFFYGISIFRSPKPSFSASGLLSLPLTDENGNIAYNLDIGSIVNDSIPEGSTLKLTASYFSATGEKVDKTVSLTTAFSQYALSLGTTFTNLDSIWPATPFGVLVGLFDYISNAPVTGVTVNFELYPANNLPKVASDGAVTFASLPLLKCSCKLTSGSTFCCAGTTLPDFGRYFLSASATPTGVAPVVSAIELGRSYEAWTLDPIRSYVDLFVSLDKSQYPAGSSVTLSFYNPFGNKGAAIVQWGCSKSLDAEKQLVFPVLPNPSASGLTEIRFNLGTESPEQSFVDVVFVLVAPRQTGRLSSLSKVALPVSILFDADAPVQITKTFQIEIVKPPKTLAVSVQVAKPVLAPAQKASFTVQVTQDSKAVKNAEVAIFVVDKAVLDLFPVAPSQLDKDIAASYVYSYYPSVASSYEYLSFVSSYAKSLSTLLQRISANPWATPEPWVLNYKASSGIDVSLQSYMEMYVQWLTDGISQVLPVSIGVPVPEQFAKGTTLGDGAPPVFASARANQLVEPPSPSSSTTTRTKFVTTPYFVGKVKTNSDGFADLAFQLPDNLGTFEITAYAITTDGWFGHGTDDQIVRRDFSMQYSGPSIVRAGDKFEAGVAITISNPNFNGDVIVEVRRPCGLLDIIGGTDLDLVSPPGVTRRLTGVGPHKVTFQFLALGVGEVSMAWSVRLASSRSFSDAALFNQSLVGIQEPVYIATSMAINANTQSTEYFQPPASVPLSGKVGIDLGVGRFAAVSGFTSIIKQRLDYTPSIWISADDYLGFLVSQYALNKYSQPIDTTTINRVIDTLERMTTSKGLQYFVPEVNIEPYTSVSLQAFALFVQSLIVPGKGVTGLTAGDSIVQSGYISKLQTLSTIWKSAMESALANQVYLSRTYKYSVDYNTLAFVYLGVGISWVPTDPVSAVDLSLSNLIGNSSALSTDSLAALTLAISRSSAAQKPDVTPFITSLVNLLKPQGRTMYISNGVGQANPTFIGTALALVDFLLTPSAPQIDKLANFVAQVDSTSQAYYSSSQLSYYVVALSLYDKAKGNTAPQLSVNVLNTTDTSSNTLISARFDSVLSRPVSKVFNFEDIGRVTFKADGSGEVSVVFGATFVPEKVSPTPIVRGMTVEKVIQAVDPITFEAVGSPITSAKLGDYVRVTIQVTIPDFTSLLYVVDSFPGALEPQDSNIYNTGASNTGPVVDYFFWWFPRVTVTTQYFKNKVVFLAGSAYAGTHTFSYLALVNGAGEFVNGPALAYDQRQPEVCGLSAGGNFTTREMGSGSHGWDQTCFRWISRSLDYSTVPADFLPAKIINNDNSTGKSLCCSLIVTFVLVVMAAFM